MKRVFKIAIAIWALLSLSSAYATTEVTSGRWLAFKEVDIDLSPQGEDKRNRMFSLQFETNGNLIYNQLKTKFRGKWEQQGETLTIEWIGSDEIQTLSIEDHDGKKIILYKGMAFMQHPAWYAGLVTFWEYTGMANLTWGHAIMLFVGLLFIFLAIRYDYEPLLLVPIGFGILIGNIPFFQAPGFSLQVGIYEEGSVLNYLYQGVLKGIYPPLIFLGIGAMTDFSSLISNPKLMLLGASAQIGIFLTFIGALLLGFVPPEAGAIGIIGGADGPTSIFIASRLANGINTYMGETVLNLIGPISIAAYSYMALVPVLQPPVMKLLIPKREMLIRMKPPRPVSKLEKILFPIGGLLLTTFLCPAALPLLGMLFFGNLLKESGVTERLANTARTSMIDIVTIILGLTVGVSTQADVFLRVESLKIFFLGAFSFIIATAGGLLFARFMNLFLKKESKINPLIGAAGVSAVPDSARVVQNFAVRRNPTNHLLMHAMAPNVSGVIGSAVAAGILLASLQ